MASFTASRRMLEVAVRKVLGASRKVLMLAAGRFLSASGIDRQF